MNTWFLIGWCYIARQDKDKTATRELLKFLESRIHWVITVAYAALPVVPDACFSRFVKWTTTVQSISVELKHVLRPANKPALADAIWSLLPSDGIKPSGQRQHVWMIDIYCIRFHGCMVPPLMVIYASSTQIMSSNSMVMLSSSLMDTCKSFLQKMVLMNINWWSN